MHRLTGCSIHTPTHRHIHKTASSARAELAVAVRKEVSTFENVSALLVGGLL